MANAAELAILLTAKDMAGPVLEGLKGKLSHLEVGLKTAAVAMTAVGGAGLVMVESARGLNAQLGQTAITLGMTQGKVRDLALSITDVSTPLDEVAGLFEILARAGVRNEAELVASAKAFDLLADATGGAADQVAATLIPAFKVFGISLADADKQVDKFTWLTKNTTIDLGDFASVMQYVAKEGGNLGVTLDDMVSIMAILESRGITGSAATRLFRTAVTEAVKEGKDLNEVLGISMTQLENQKVAVEGAAKGISEKYNVAAQEQYGIMANLKQMVGELTFKFGGLLEPLEPVLAGMTALGPILLFSTTPAVAKLTAAFYAMGVAAWASLGPYAALAGVAALSGLMWAQVQERGIIVGMEGELWELNEATQAAVKADKDAAKASLDTSAALDEKAKAAEKAKEQAELLTRKVKEQQRALKDTQIGIQENVDTLKTYRDEMYNVTLAQLVGTQAQKDLTAAQIDARAAASSLLSAQIASAQQQGFQAAQGGQAINRGVAGNLPPPGYQVMQTYGMTEMGLTAINALTASNAAMGAMQIAAAAAAETAATIGNLQASMGYQFGGTVPGPIGRPQLAVVHGGETVTPPGKAGVTIIFNGDVYGLADFQRKVAEAVKASYRGGGLRFLG